MVVRKSGAPVRRQLNIRTLAHLSRRLNVGIEILKGVAESIGFQYVALQIRKKDGGKSPLTLLSYGISKSGYCSYRCRVSATTAEFRLVRKLFTTARANN